MTPPSPIERVLLIVADSAGVGAMPDAARFGDEGSATLPNTARATGGLHLPHLSSLGLGNVAPILGVPPAFRPLASFGRMAEFSDAKDTTTGHWEMAGLPLDAPWSFYPEGFPPAIIEAFKAATGVLGVLGNKAASGTAILAELGEEHERTGWPIVYTSADSVFQIAAHEEVIPLDRLYSLCEAARRILDPYRVSRVIARPFVGTRREGYRRTYNRRDFCMPPPKDTVLDLLRRAGVPVVGVGKIEDIFAGRGVTESHHTEGNRDGMATTVRILESLERGLIFVNLVDFDMLYGHRRDAAGYARALAEFDEDLGTLLGRLRPSDLLLITADHGCDPTFLAHTDHTREYVPLLALRGGGGGAGGRDLGTRNGFCDVGATVAAAFGVGAPPPGVSFLDSIP